MATSRGKEVVTRAHAEGPQFVYRRKDSVVVVARREYERLTGKRSGFKEFLTGKGPSLDALDLTRDRGFDAEHQTLRVSRDTCALSECEAQVITTAHN